VSGWTERRGLIALVAATTVLGLGLRYYDLGDQIILDDEWHGLRRAATQDLQRLATTQFKGATSIAMNLYYRLVLEYWGWSEVSVRFLSILATLATLAVLPLIVARVFQSKLLAILVGLQFAISPFWVFYGQSSRPYAPFLLFTLLGLYFLYSATTKRSYWTWFGYAVSTALASYFHLFALPALAAAALVPLSRLYTSARRDGLLSPAFRGELWPQMAGHALAVALLLTAYLPAIERGMIKRLPAQQGLRFFDGRSVQHALELLTGVRFAVAGGILFCLSLVGLRLLARRNPAFLATLVAATLGSLLFTLATKPYDYHVAIVTLRYNIVIFPLFFLGIAGAVEFASTLPARAGQRFPWARRRWPAVAVAVLFTIVSIALSPIPQLLAIQPNNFRLHSAYQQNYSNWSRDRAYDSDMFSDGLRQKASAVSKFYGELGAAGRPCELIEFPLPLPDAWDPYYFYQLHHGCRVSIGYSRQCTIGRILNSTNPSGRLHFQRLVNIEDRESLLRSGAGHLVVHVDLDRENQGTTDRAPVLAKEVRSALRLLNKSLGAPVYKDQHLVVFSLQAERAKN
jgi:hypothetical protein